MKRPPLLPSPVAARLIASALIAALVAAVVLTHRATSSPIRTYLSGTQLDSLHADHTAAFFLTVHDLSEVRPEAIFQFKGTGGWKVPDVTDPQHPGVACGGGDAPTMVTPYRPGISFELGDYCHTAKIMLLPTKAGPHTFTIRLYSHAQDNPHPPWGGTTDPSSQVTQLRWRGNVLADHRP